MTASHVPRPTPARNWGAVVIAAAGAFALACDGWWVVALVAPFSSVLIETAFILQVATLSFVPIAVLVGFVPLSFGARGFASIAGTTSRTRLLVFAAPVVACVAQLVIVAAPLFETGMGQQALETSVSGILILAVFAVLLVIVAGIVIARAGIARGFARWSLLVALLLTLVTLALYSAGLAVVWQDVPRSIGLVALGIGYWRAGRTAPVAEDSRVPVGSKSLAE
jgi:hypothetical protein